MSKRAPLKFDAEEVLPAPRAVITPIKPVETTQMGVRISSDLYRRLKARAALQGLNLGALVELAVKHELERE